MRPTLAFLPNPAPRGWRSTPQGNAFFVAFARASDAVGAIVDTQQELPGRP